MKLINGFKAVWKYWNYDKVENITDNEIETILSDLIRRYTVGKVSDVLFGIFTAIILIMYIKYENSTDTVVIVLVVTLVMMVNHGRREKLVTSVLLWKLYNNYKMERQKNSTIAQQGVAPEPASDQKKK